jgi:hypothetical protein
MLGLPDPPKLSPIAMCPHCWRALGVDECNCRVAELPKQVAELFGVSITCGQQTWNRMSRETRQLLIRDIVQIGHAIHE